MAQTLVEQVVENQADLRFEQRQAEPASPRRSPTPAIARRIGQKSPGKASASHAGHDGCDDAVAAYSQRRRISPATAARYLYVRAANPDTKKMPRQEAHQDGVWADTGGQLGDLTPSRRVLGGLAPDGADDRPAAAAFTYEPDAINGALRRRRYHLAMSKIQTRRVFGRRCSRVPPCALPRPAFAQDPLAESTRARGAARRGSAASRRAGCLETGERPQTGIPGAVEILQSQVAELAQTKVESTSRAPVKLFGTVHANLFANSGNPNWLDIPNLVSPPPADGHAGTTSASSTDAHRADGRCDRHRLRSGPTPSSRWTSSVAFRDFKPDR